MRRLLLVFLLCWIGKSAWTQSTEALEVIEPQWQGRVGVSDPVLYVSRGGKEKDTVVIKSGEPFFDDFSRGTTPDTTQWDLCASDPPRYPSIMRHAAVEPPSLGAAMFDGVSSDNKPYEEDLLRGPCDRLESHYIDLDNLDPDSDVWLSFFLQPQGFGHAPTSRDSFRVFLNAQPKSDPNQDSLVMIYSQAGSRVKDFKQFTFRISNPIFFHTRFYMVFESYGFQNGVLNTWHLDYVSLGLERTPTDTFYQDRSVCYLDQSPFDPYTAIPYQQYQAGQLANRFSVITSNLKDQAEPVNMLSEITDPIGGNSFSPPYSQTFSGSVPAYDATNIAANAFLDNQNLSNPYAATFRQRVELTGSKDSIPENDYFINDFRIDTIMAYDDGEADAGYGLNKARGFAQEFDVRSTDSLMAVWIAFAPQSDFFNGGSIEGEPFEVTIWFDAHPDSILYSESMNEGVVYGDTTNHFQRYRLAVPVSVTGTIYVGVTQLTTAAIGVGMDWSYDNQDKIFWDSLGNWTASRFPATLMIRPEFRNIIFNPPPFTAIDEDFQASPLQFFPNPTYGKQLFWEGQRQVRNVDIQLFDIQGKAFPVKIDRLNQQIELPHQLSAGMYLLRYQLVDLQGKTHVGTQKIWLK